MAQKQTFIIHTYSKSNGMDFHRVSCKKLDTCFKYLRNWRKQGEECIGLTGHFCKREFCAENATYSIEATPNGYSGEIIARGLISEL